MPSRRHADEFLAALDGAGEILIIPHDNPDPDSLASSAALRRLVGKRTDKWPKIAISGTIGRAENRAMVAALELKLTPLGQLRDDFSGAVVMVDTQPGRANNSLPSGLTPTAVIDHHPDWGGNEGVRFLDLREGYGATSTIATEYLQQAEIPMGPRLATALFYGISSETRHLGRETEPSDIVACQFLYPYVDKRVLSAIESPPLPQRYFQLTNDAIYSSVLCDDVALCLISAVPYPDAPAEVADLLVRTEGVTWATCIAPFDDGLVISVRANDPDATAGRMLASLLPSGSAGGHDMTAAGRLALNDRDWASTSCELALQLLRALGRTGSDCSWLVPRRGPNEPDTRGAALLLERLSLTATQPQEPPQRSR